MRYQDLSLEVGRRGLDDRSRLKVPGRLITPDSKSKVLLIVSAGVLGKHPDYFEHFGKLLGEEFNVYITEHRRRGGARGGNLRRDFYQIDQQVRDMVETDDVFYVGHSMGTTVAKRSTEEFGQRTLGLYGVCAYPSLGDSRAKTSDPNVRSVTQKLIDLISKTEIGPLASLTAGNNLPNPSRMAIGDNDYVIMTYKPEVLQRFIAKFKAQGAQTRVFPGMNHCFNHEPHDYSPFNRDDPQLLVKDVQEFVHRTLTK